MTIVAWLVAVPVLVASWWFHEGGRYFAGKLVGAKQSVRWWGIACYDSRGKRAAAALGGLVASYVACAAVAFAFSLLHGIDSGPARVFVGEVALGYDAVDKLAPGDVILAVDGEQLFADLGPSLVDRVNAKDGAPVTVAIDRDGAQREVTVQPKRGDRDGRTVWLLGIRPGRMRTSSTDVGASLAIGVRYPFAQVRRILFGSDEPVGGPVRIVEEYRRAGDDYSWLKALALLAVHLMLVLAIVDAVRLVPRYAERT